ncbi:tubulin-binding prefolding complex subunit GIM4 SCDLUD_005158 [Saccharomycodes ludwigii]|uniref:tubulin-binding prefolding complex subunit GIM4 n=1 Tax=Saccharomycodes ludwigii TaxID=36035 RepID=UPI001E81C72B|nr:hypothetical protein SCDLUD_005158 [Saccharomycodes ludwigii]KAH3898820.1 hypothetical protein SCDLUD_005158 [Saccharomycodes ludwigii]
MATDKESSDLKVLQAQYEEFKQEYRAVQNKLFQLQHEKEEYEVVLETLKKADPKRKCYRAVGNSLLETNAEKATPILKNRCLDLEKAVTTYKGELKTALKSLDDWKKNNKITDGR